MKLLKRSERGFSPRRHAGDLARRDRLFKAVADSFFSDSPVMRYLRRAGKGRLMMQRYRQMKQIHRPQEFRQDRWN